MCSRDPESGILTPSSFDSHEASKGQNNFRHALPTTMCCPSGGRSTSSFRLAHPLKIQSKSNLDKAGWRRELIQHPGDLNKETEEEDEDLLKEDEGAEQGGLNNKKEKEEEKIQEKKLFLYQL